MVKSFWILEAVRDPVTDRFSESKFFAIVGKTAMTFGFVWVIVVHKSSSEWLWLTYGGALLGHEWARRRQSYQAKEKDK